jgi:hypothetical protein
VFAAVAKELGRLFGAETTYVVRLLRFEPDGETVTLAADQGTPRPHVEAGLWGADCDRQRKRSLTGRP